MIAESFERTRPSAEAVALLRADFQASVANDVSRASEAPRIEADRIEADRIEILDPETPRERYFRLRDESQTLVEHGRLEEALERGNSALEIARELEDDELASLAACNVAAIGIALGKFDRFVGDLRGVLMRNYSCTTSFAAAYNLAHAYELKKDFKKSLFYARIARDRAEASGDPELRAKGRCQVGAGLVGDSQFRTASETFESALVLMRDDDTPVAITARLFLGYCKTLMGKHREGFGILFRCLRQLRRRELPVFESWARTYLSFAYLEKGRLRRAWVHARRSLDLAETTGDYDAIKTALFLLGEIEATAGDTPAAFEWFRQMQERFYPEHETTPQLMAAVGTLGMVNLGA